MKYMSPYHASEAARGRKKAAAVYAWWRAHGRPALSAVAEQFGFSRQRAHRLLSKNQRYRSRP